MPPRRPRTRAVKSSAPSPSPTVESRSSSRKGSKKASEEIVEEENEEEEVGDGVEAVAQGVEEEHEDAVEAESEVVEVEDGDTEDGTGGADGGDVEGDVEGGDTEIAESSKMSMADRLAKLKDLRIRMNQSTTENRRDLVADHQKSRVTAKELARLEKQRKLAQTLRLKADAEENGEDLERRKAWEWSIEQNERWEAKMAEQKVKSDTSFHNAEDEAHKLYNRNLRSTKPDLLAYERQKELALGLPPGTLVPTGTTSAQLAISRPSRISANQGLTLSEDLYRDANTLSYGDSKPTEDAVDRVVGKINKDMSKGKKKKRDDEDEPVTYINDRNKVFNKKIARYFDKYTKEIRANFERGTAL